MSVPSSANERAAEPDASTTTSPAGGLGGSHQMRAVERDEVGAELFDRPPACALRSGKEHAPGRPRELGERGRPGRRRWERKRARPRAHAASRPSRGRPRRSSAARPAPGRRARARRSGSSRSPTRSPRRRPARRSGSIRISGHSTTSWPSSSSRATSRPACSRGRVTITFTQEPATAARRRARPDRPRFAARTQRPSGSATRAVSVSPSWYAAIGARHPPPIETDTAALGRDPPLRLRVVRGRDELLLADADLQRERALARLGKQLLRVEAMADLRAEPEPVEPAGGEDDGVEAALAALAQPGVDVSAERLDRERRLEREQLRAAAHRGRPDPHPGPDRVRAAERVARILARPGRRRRRGRPCPSRSCPSPSGRRRRSARRGAPPRAPSRTRRARRSRRTASSGRGRRPS